MTYGSLWWGFGGRWSVVAAAGAASAAAASALMTRFLLGAFELEQFADGQRFLALVARLTPSTARLADAAHDVLFVVRVLHHVRRQLFQARKCLIHYSINTIIVFIIAFKYSINSKSWKVDRNIHYQSFL